VLRYLIRRVLWAMVLFVAVTIVTYVIFYAIPADPARLACIILIVAGTVGLRFVSST